MSEEVCFVNVVERISYCAYGVDWWLLVGSLLAVGIALLRRGLGTKRIQESPGFGPAARWLRADGGTVLLALVGGVVACALVAWCTGACEAGGVFGAGAVSGLVALGILAVARAFGSSGSSGPTEPPPDRTATVDDSPHGLWCPPAPSPNSRYQARRRCA